MMFGWTPKPPTEVVRQHCPGCQVEWNGPVTLDKCWLCGHLGYRGAFPSAKVEPQPFGSVTLVGENIPEDDYI